jgi:hypothetical protein
MVAVVLGSSILLTDTAAAQMVNGVAQPPAKPSSARQGVIVTPPPAPVRVLPANPSYPDALLPRIPVQPAQPVQFTLVPAIIMSDGSILANFGFGYEPVLRSCSSPVVVVVGGAPRRIAGNGVSIPNNNAPSAAPQQQIVLSAAAQSSCFTRDGFGRVFVYRRS